MPSGELIFRGVIPRRSAISSEVSPFGQPLSISTTRSENFIDDRLLWGQLSAILPEVHLTDLACDDNGLAEFLPEIYLGSSVRLGPFGN